ncbi:MAG: tRNA (adenosine(37)-N6)-threonylcarbamoyltransferase complex dimerization subunit type 1 TsaB [Hyphomicrobium sp.]|nr:tRNA (adenosine(37)-N6)-threonylcarbamoyltransferase complex dimerization subunit type 1 TsaB [Hyphomicrobium sp.]
MNILAFDTCFDGCSVCLAEWRQGVVVERSARMERFEAGHAERLIPMIGEAMEEARLRFDELERIAVTIGPGTFTGTRIGIAAARSLALATGVGTVGASSLAVMAEVARRKIRPDVLAVVVDARRGEVYAQLFGSGGGRDAISPPQLLSVEEAALLGGRGPIVFVGSGATLVAAVAARQGRDARAALPDLLPDAVALAHLATSLEVSDAPLIPFYLRPPDAKPQDGKAIARL